MTRLETTPEATDDLPFVLSVSGSGEDLDESRWADAKWSEHFDGTDSVEREAYRVLYVNGSRWGAFETTHGLRMLPEDNSGTGWVGQPLLSRRWGELSFIETGSMTSGTDRAEIGLATDTAVVCFTNPDEESDVLELDHRENDAEAIVTWLLNGALTSRYDFGWGGDERIPLLAQLFVEASLNGRNGERIQGSWLAAGIASDDSFGVSDSAEWTLRLNLEPDVTEAVLERLAEQSIKLREIVTAGRDPDSPAGQARRAAVEAAFGE